MEKNNTDDIKQWYRRKKWNDVKQVVIERDGGRCQECKKMITGRFIIHHHVPGIVKIFMIWITLNLFVRIVTTASHSTMISTRITDQPAF